MLEEIRAAWSAVGGDLRDDLVVSERCVQASFYHHLRIRLAAAGRRPILLAEPRIQVAVDKALFPDLYVGDGGEAWFFEFKLQNAARQGVQWAKDFATFAALEHAATADTLLIDPRADSVVHRVPERRRYVFGAVGEADCLALDLPRLRAEAAPLLTTTLASNIFWAGGFTKNAEWMVAPLVPG